VWKRSKLILNLILLASATADMAEFIQLHDDGGNYN
jgi:hypothetical protein